MDAALVSTVVGGLLVGAASQVSIWVQFLVQRKASAEQWEREQRQRSLQQRQEAYLEAYSKASFG